MSSNALDFDSLLKQIPFGDIASRFGVDEATAHSAASKALPGLLGGLANNARSEGGAQDLEAALLEHQREVNTLDEVDVADGEKIVSHALGSKRTQVVSAVSGGDDDLVSKIMPVLAPIVMAFLAKNLGQSRSSGTGGGIADVLGSILGSGSSPSRGLGGILGSILGGR